MPRRANELSGLEVGRLRAQGFHPVGGVPGLGMQIVGASRSWILRYSFDGRRPEMGLGPFPEVGLAQARQRAAEARALAREGVDPIGQRRAARSASAASRAASKTFREHAINFIAAKTPEWANEKHAAQWTATLKTYAFPVVGSLLMADIGTEHVLEILRPIWLTKTETATRLRARLEAVIAHGDKRSKLKRSNPASWAELSDELPSADKARKAGTARAVVHHPALPYAQLPAFTERLRTVPGQGARALEFAILCAARSGEVRGARWSEIDGETWTVPAERMKMRREHRVPLSDAALQLLADQAADVEFVFPGAQGRPISDMTMTAVCRRLGVDAVPHGFRATFKTWASEQTAFPREVIEAALAHVIGNKTEEAYQRGDLFDKRRRLMQAWADYCSSTPATASVTPIRKDRAARTAA